MTAEGSRRPNCHVAEYTRFQSNRQKDVPVFTSTPPNWLKPTGQLKPPECTLRNLKLHKIMVETSPLKCDLTKESSITNPEHQDAK